jgi:hypothetical protein
MIKRRLQRGYILLGLILIIGITVPLMIIFVGWSVTSLKVVQQTLHREVAFHIAEAGIDYYRWHLAHDPEDFEDGTGGPGPYVHDFEDKNGTVIGSFSLEITPPEPGSTLVVIESTGTALANPGVTRTIRSQLAIPSLAKYSVVANADIRFGGGTEVFGPIHSNGGIRFDGFAHNIVSSAKETYEDDDGDACTFDSWGVHTCLSPSDPAPTLEPPARPDVFAAGRDYPIPQVDFDGFTTDFADMKDAAIANGHYYGPSGRQGYQITLNTDDTYTIEEVRRVYNSPHSWCYSSQANWGTWSVRRTRNSSTHSFPSDGVIFVEDDLWVRGQIDGARLMIGAAEFPDNPSDRKSITVNEDLLYTNYDGTDTIGLMAQLNINAGLYSEDDLRVDAAMVAQHGRIGRFYYSSWCGSYHDRDTYTSYGMIGTNQRYGFAYTDNTGYDIRNLIYDGNLLYSPPPSFPLTSETYAILSWEELE